jgi:hypothetical protein
MIIIQARSITHELFEAKYVYVINCGIYADIHRPLL